jgi:hypothetical protein
LRAFAIERSFREVRERRAIRSFDHRMYVGRRLNAKQGRSFRNVEHAPLCNEAESTPFAVRKRAEPHLSGAH